MKRSKFAQAKRRKQHEDNELDLAAIMMGGGWLLGESGRSVPHVDDDLIVGSHEIGGYDGGDCFDGDDDGGFF